MTTRTLPWALGPPAAGQRLPIVPWPWIALLLVGYPLLMTARSLAWRAIGPEGLTGLGYYVPFWLTVIVMRHPRPIPRSLPV